MDPLVYTIRISKAEYLGGRFLAAFSLNAVLLLAVQAGMIAAVYSPGVNAQLVGPFRPAAYLTAYLFLSLPNAFFATALQFALALRSGRPMAAYLGSLFIVFMGFFVASLLLFRRGLGTLLDPVGIRFVVEDIAHLWTTIEKNRRLLAFEGIVLQNRLVWIGVACRGARRHVPALSFRASRRSTAEWFRRRAGRARAEPARIGVTRERADLRSAGPALVRLRRARASDARHRVDVVPNASRRAGPDSACFAAFRCCTVPVVLDQMVASGTPLIPTTGQVLSELTGPLTSELSRWVIIPLLIVFFAGELVWRERDAGAGRDRRRDAGAGLGPVPRQVPRTRTRARRVHGAPDDGRDARSGRSSAITTSTSVCT